MTQSSVCFTISSVPCLRLGSTFTLLRHSRLALIPKDSLSLVRKPILFERISALRTLDAAVFWSSTLVPTATALNSNPPTIDLNQHSSCLCRACLINIHHVRHYDTSRHLNYDRSADCSLVCQGESSTAAPCAEATCLACCSAHISSSCYIRHKLVHQVLQLLPAACIICTPNCTQDSSCALR